MGAVDEGLAEIELAALYEVVGESLQHVLQRSAFHPALKAPEARGIRRIPLWHVSPRGSGTKDPENPVEDITWVPPRSPTTVFSNWKSRQKRLECYPLLVGQVHRDFRSQTCSSVDLVTFRSDIAELRLARL
jgi:hypothetical protein